MKLIIGGYAQGKLSYVLSQLSGEKSRDYVILDESSCEIPSPDSVREKKVIVNHLHLVIKTTDGKEQAEARIRELQENCKAAGAELILICDELGSGVVPAVYEDRVYRENVGRILCDLAKEADSVERIVCGISCRIK